MHENIDQMSARYWALIRTSIGIMAFGFMVVKFSLFIKQIALLIGKNTTIPANQALGLKASPQSWYPT